jgi:hypothetical protein
MRSSIALAFVILSIIALVSTSLAKEQEQSAAVSSLSSSAAAEESSIDQSAIQPLGDSAKETPAEGTDSQTPDEDDDETSKSYTTSVLS